MKAELEGQRQLRFQFWIWLPLMLCLFKNRPFLNLLELRCLFSLFSWAALKHGIGCQDIQSNCYPFFLCHRNYTVPKYRKKKHHTLYEPFIALTLLRPGVVFAKGIVFGYIWVQKSQWIFRNVFSCHHFVVANDIRESDSRQLLLGVWFHRMELGLCRWEK